MKNKIHTNRNKYYRVVEVTNNEGKSFFIVQASQHWIDLLFNLWPIEYELQNTTLNLAIHQIEMLNKWKIRKLETVFFKRACKNDKPIPD